MDNLLNTILQMLEGSEITLEIFFITLVIALPLGMLAALGRLSKLRPLSAFMEFYIWLMRGTPLMLQLLFVYFALPMIGIRLPDIAAALLAFTLNYAAYFAEIFRAGIQSVPKGCSREGARFFAVKSVTVAWPYSAIPAATTTSSAKAAKTHAASVAVRLPALRCAGAWSTFSITPSLRSRAYAGPKRRTGYSPADCRRTPTRR